MCTIPEFPATGTPQEFYQKHVLPSVPAIVRGLQDIKEWPASQWKTFQQIGESIGPDIKVLVEHGVYIEEDFSSTNIDIHEYLKLLDESPSLSAGYIAQCPIFHQVPELEKLIRPPSVR